MKILTMNVHSHLEADYESKVRRLAEFLIRERADLIALQECSQTACAEEAEEKLREGMAPCGCAVPVRSDNHAARLAQLLREAGLPVSWVWTAVKRGYDRLDEGLAVLSVGQRIGEAESRTISRTDDYHNWKRRSLLAIRPEGAQDWFCCLHMGWWQDKDEPFKEQWENARSILAEKKNRRIFLMGDFNSPSQVRSEGYDLVRGDGWHDLFLAAEEKRGSATVYGLIDGWQGQTPGRYGLRIDHIFCNRLVRVRSAKIVFDGEKEKRISDHSGVLIELE